jgi:thiol-disulfide isomerase/thioredoxin
VNAVVPSRSTRRSAPALAAGLAVLATLASVAGCSTGSGGTYVDATGAITVIAADRRGEAVTVAGRTLEGADFDAASLQGRIAVLNVWYSTCVPCRKEAPELERAYRSLEPQGVAFLGINVKQGDEAQAVAFQKAFGISYPSLVDDGGRALLGLRGAVSPNMIPSTVVLDPQGRVAARISGQTTAATVLGVVDAVRTGQVRVTTPTAAAPAGSATP